MFTPPRTHDESIGAFRAVARTLGIIMLCGACIWGTRPEQFSPANKPVGAEIVIAVGGAPNFRWGELFAVDSDGVVILFAVDKDSVVIKTNRLVRVAWGRVVQIKVDGMTSEYQIKKGKTVTAEQRQRLALTSRFPQGLTGDLMARVLVTLKQEQLVVLQ